MEFLSYMFGILFFCGLIYFIILMIIFIEDVIKTFNLQIMKRKKKRTYVARMIKIVARHLNRSLYLTIVLTWVFIILYMVYNELDKLYNY